MDVIVLGPLNLKDIMFKSDIVILFTGTEIPFYTLPDVTRTPSNSLSIDGSIRVDIFRTVLYSGTIFVPRITMSL